MTARDLHVVIGASGHAGRHALAALAARHRVRAAEPGDDLAAALSGAAAVHVTVDLRPPLLKHRGPWRPHPFLEAVVTAARAQGVRRLVRLSSAHVYGVGSAGIVTEDSPRRSHHWSERLRLHDDEWLLAERGLEVVVLRPVQGFGAGEPVAQELARRLRHGALHLPGGGQADRTFLAGPDLGRAFAAAAERGKAGRAYILGGFDARWLDLVEVVARSIPGRVRVVAEYVDLAWVTAAIGTLRLPPGEPAWPSPYTVELFGRELLVDDASSRRELSWSPMIGAFADGSWDAGSM